MGKKIGKVLYHMDEYLANLCGAGLVVVTLLGIFMRYVLSSPLKWTEEVSLGLFVWYIFLGAGSTFKGGMNVTIDFLVDLFPKKVQRVVEVFVHIISYIVMFAMFAFGCRFCVQTRLKITPVLRLPYTVVAVALPVGFALMIIYQTIGIIKSWKERKNEKEESK